MTLDLDLTSGFAKVDRAVEHLEVLEREIPTSWANVGPYAVRFSDVDPQTGWCDVSLVPEPEKPCFGIMVGDVIHNLRSALDYVVTALADASNVAVTTRHQFPIFRDATLYASAVGTLTSPVASGPLGGLRHGFALIERLQPYHLQPDPRSDPLWHVHRFSNADKHRRISTLLAIPSGTLDLAFEGQVVENDHIMEIPDWAPYEETVIHRLRFDPPIARNLRVTSPMTVAYAFSTPPFGSEPVHTIAGPLLRNACDYVRMVLGSFGLL